MVVTGLEVGGIVVGCVNAGLGAAKLLMDWRNKKKERKQIEANLKLEQTLRSDAGSIETTYSHHLLKLRKSDRQRFENGDDASLKELRHSSIQMQNAMRDLRQKIRSSKAHVVPDMARFVAASKNAQQSIVRSLVQLYKRIELEMRVPRSLNPFKLFRRPQNRLQRLEPSHRTDNGNRNSDPSRLITAPVLGAALLGFPVDASAAQPTSNLSAPAPAPQLPWEFEMPVHTARCPCIGQVNICTCAAAARQVIIVDRIYVDQSQRTVKSPRRSRPKETEIVLVRRRKK